MIKQQRFIDGAVIFGAVIVALVACATFHLGLGWFIFYMVSGAITEAIARGKNRNSARWFALGVLFIGFALVAALLPKLGDPAPDGWRSVKCPRCNTVQNINKTVPDSCCYHCHTVIDTIGHGPLDWAPPPRRRSLADFDMPPMPPGS